MKKYLEILRNCKLFENIADENLLAMLSCLGAEVRSYTKNQNIFTEGERASHMGILLSGTAQIIRVDFYGNRSIVTNIEPPQLFGESFACTETKSIRTARNNPRWHDSTVRKILENEKYMGDALLQKTYTIDFLNKKRGKNNGTLPQYYIEDDHEAIIPKDIFMRVQEEMARRSSERDMNGRRQGFSANHAFSHMVTCECCGEHFRRLHWNNRGKKTIVWRCKTRLEDKTRCLARTVSEDELQQGFIDAVNEMLGNNDEYLKKLKSNLKTAISFANPQSAEALAERMRQLQQELIDRTESGMNYDDLAEEILRLRELQEQTVMDDAAKAAHRERIQELMHFINSQPRTITEFDETLVKKLLESVKVCESFLEFRFKSGVTISIEK